MKANVLIVEDDYANALVGGSILSELGFKWESASSGIEALKKVVQDHDRWCAILMDIHLPVMGGLEAMRLIRAYEKENNLNPIMIVAVSASAFTQDKARSLAAGANEFLSKPYRMENIRAALVPHCALEASA